MSMGICEDCLETVHLDDEIDIIAWGLCSTCRLLRMFKQLDELIIQQLQLWNDEKTQTGHAQEGS